MHARKTEQIRSNQMEDSIIKWVLEKRVELIMQYCTMLPGHGTTVITDNASYATHFLGLLLGR